MNEKSIQLFIRLALVLLSIARDWSTTAGQTDSQIARAVREKADKAIKEGEEFLASLPAKE